VRLGLFIKKIISFLFQKNCFALSAGGTAFEKSSGCEREGYITTVQLEF
jgi:hypothetical protein